METIYNYLLFGFGICIGLYTYLCQKYQKGNDVKPVFEYLGHSGMLITYFNTRLLIDPWFDSAFLQSWYPYPYNKFLKKETIAQSIDFLWISHAHEDHCSDEFLKYLDKSTKIIIADFKGNNLINRLEKLKFNNIIKLSHKRSYKLNDRITVQIICDTSYKEDSSLFVNFDNINSLF